MNNSKNTYIFKENLFRDFILVVVKFLLKLFIKIEIINPGNIQIDGPVIFAANHISGFDALVMQAAIPRPICFMGKAELYKNPLVGWILTQLGSFPVKRGEFDRQSILNARSVLDSGYAMMMFPEGTRTYGQGMIEARTGTAHMAMRFKSVVIPAALTGAEKIFKNGLKKANVSVEFGQPIIPGDRENAGQLTERIMQMIAQKLPEQYQGFYA